jgi:hypothetical protein
LATLTAKRRLTRDVFFSFDEREDELNEWLEQMLYLQQGKNGNIYGKKPKPTFENVYQVRFFIYI